MATANDDEVLDDNEEDEAEESEDEDDKSDDKDEGEGKDDKDKGSKDDKSKQSKRTPEEELAHLEGRTKRLRKKLGKDKEEEKPSAEKPKTELDYGQKAYLKSSGITGADEFALVREYMATGKTLDDIVDNKHFKNDLEDLREKRATREAKPKGAGRSGQTGTGSVDHWIQKGGLPENTPENQKLRRDIVAARAKGATSGSKFYNS